MGTPACCDDGRSISSFKILVLEDYEPFCRFVCSVLRKRPEFEVIWGVSDGLEAVHRAKELHPDLILLDVGLPTLNGIEATRRIRRLSPESRIVFLSQESSPDGVQEAFRLGALSYLAKTDAGLELLATVDAACHGSGSSATGPT